MALAYCLLLAGLRGRAMLANYRDAANVGRRESQKVTHE